jgi:hypothetical protein
MRRKRKALTVQVRALFFEKMRNTEKNNKKDKKAKDRKYNTYKG